MIKECCMVVNNLGRNSKLGETLPVKHKLQVDMWCHQQLLFYYYFFGY